MGGTKKVSDSSSLGNSETPLVVDHPEEVISSNSSDNSQLKTRTALGLLTLIFVFSLSALLFVYYSFPDLDEEEAKLVKFPTDIEDAKKLGLVLSRYKDKYYAQVLGGVFVTYLFLQTFAIPGSIFLSIVSGYLFPFFLALLLICVCSATGASFCYLLSYLVGRRLVHKYLPERSASWSEKVKEHRNNMLSYIIFLRITPFLPNWFINIVSPVIDVDLKPFWLGTFIGVAPPSFVAIQAGTTLQQLTSTTDALSVTSVALLALFAILSILPVIFRDRKSIAQFFRSCCSRCQSFLPRVFRCRKREVDDDDESAQVAAARPNSPQSTSLSETATAIATTVSSSSSKTFSSFKKSSEHSG